MKEVGRSVHGSVGGEKWPPGIALVFAIVLMFPIGPWLPSASAHHDDRSASWRFGGKQSHVLKSGRYDVLEPEQVLLESKVDGASISMGIWRPDVPAAMKVPVIATADPYSPPGGAVIERGLEDAKELVPHGYAYAVISVRGSGDSGGCYDSLGPLEAADLDQAITWLGTREWSNGNVGMMGLSYGGSTPWVVAGVGNPHLKTVVPMGGTPDLFSLAHQDGVTNLWGPGLWVLQFYLIAGADSPSGAALPIRTCVVDPAVGLGGQLSATVTGSRDAAGWYAARDHRPGVESNYKGSILMVHGLNDKLADPRSLVPWVDKLSRMGIETKQILGQWDHATPDTELLRAYYMKDKVRHALVRYDWAQLLLTWFNEELKGIPGRTHAAVEVQDSQYRWHYLSRFPSPDVTWTDWRLAPDERLSKDPEGMGQELLTPQVLADSTDSSTPGHSADFVTPPFEQSIIVSGQPRVQLEITPLGPSGHVTAILYAVDSDGVAEELALTSINLVHRGADQPPVPVVPGRPIEVSIKMHPLHTALDPGDRLRLRIMQWWDANRSLGDRTNAHDLLPVAPAPVLLQYGKGTSSVLSLPSFDERDVSLFRPPMPGR